LKTLLAMLLLTACSLAQSNNAAPTAAQLQGSWKLVSINDTLTNGSVGPSRQFGPHPVGYLMYGPDGHMCVDIMNGQRVAWKDPVKATDSEKIASYDSFLSYCGTYKVDGEQSTVTHYPEVSSRPSYVGSAQVRLLRLMGNRLILIAANTDPGVQTRMLTWERTQ